VAAEANVIIRMDRRRTAWAALLSFLFVPVGIAILRLGDIVSLVVGTVTLAFFGAGLAILLWGLIRPPVLLEISSTGVSFGGWLPTFRRSVPWEAILALRIYRFEAAPLAPGLRMLGFVPSDPQAAIWTQRRSNRMNSRMTGMPASISDRAINIGLEQLVEIMRRFRPELEVDYGEPRGAGLGKLRPSSWRHRGR
jgi:hypothetical protein